MRNGKNCLFGPAVIKVLALHSLSLSFNLGVAHILFLRTFNKEGSLICVLCSGSTWSSWSTRPHRSSRSCCKYSITACTAGMKLLQLNLSVKCFKARKKKQPRNTKYVAQWMDEYFLLNQYVSIWQIPVKITFGFLLRVFLGEIITTPRRL